MKKFFFILCSVWFLGACSLTKPVASSEKISDNNPELVVNKEVKQGSTADFSFTNNTGEKIIIHGPAFKNIEKFENNVWRKVKIIYCPCGADCIPPPKTKMLLPGQKHDYSWNLMESWCDKRKKNKNNATVETISLPGLYRIAIHYSLDSINQIKIEREFSIIP
ncbi:MAG: hypothetical protein P1P88_22300 [Bacteroidales bacterium]|nr:hypothetical protein [Bacteroidales bacterium]